jgi:type II secretory pathway component PulF
VKFEYEAMDRAGRMTRGSVEASSALEASDVLSQKGLFIETIRAVAAGGAKPGRGVVVRGFGASRSRLVANFSRDLAVLVSTGTALVSRASPGSRP